MAQSSLFDMLADLARNPESLEEWQSDPQAFMAAAGLDQDTIDKLKTNQDFRNAVIAELHRQFGGDPEGVHTDILFC